MVQRDDATSFRISDKDMLYKDAVYKAIKNGVEVIAIKIAWDTNGNHSYKDLLALI